MNPLAALIKPSLYACFVLLVLAALVLQPGRAALTSTVLVFGDSVSAAYGMRADQGWVSLLQKRLAEQGYGYRVVNASVSGETTAGGRARLKRALELHQPAVVILELGGNDGLRGLPVAQISANLESMIRDARATRAQVLLVGMRIPTNYGPVYSRQFESAFTDLARRYSLPFVPFLLENVALNKALMQQDGIHPTVNAQSRLLDTVWPKLKNLLGP